MVSLPLLKSILGHVGFLMVVFNNEIVALPHDIGGEIVKLSVILSFSSHYPRSFFEFATNIF